MLIQRLYLPASLRIDLRGRDRVGVRVRVRGTTFIKR